MEQADTPLTVDAYIAQKPVDIQPVLHIMRSIIRAVIPDADEVIAWRMPSYISQSFIVHFAAHKTHLGFYIGIKAIEQFQDRLKDYHTTKSAIQFPYAKPLPKELITEIVRFCAAQAQR